MGVQQPTEFLMRGADMRSPNPGEVAYFAYYDSNILGPYMSQEEYKQNMDRINAVVEKNSIR